MDLEKITELIVELELDEIDSAVQEALNEGKSAFSILDALTKGMNKVGKLYEEDEYFLPELALAGDTMNAALEILKPILEAESADLEQEQVVLATVKGDNHDIGKNILCSLLLSAGFKIHDLGKDVDEKIIVEKVKETGAKIVALSSLLSTTVVHIRDVNKALKDAGLRDDVKIIVGGAPLDMDLAKRFGADDFADTVVEGVRHIKELAKIPVKVKE